MNLLKQPMIVIVMLAVIAIAAAFIGESSKVAWVSNWLAPILMLLFFIALHTLTTTAPKGITTRKGKVVWWVRTAVLAGLMWLFISIDLVGDAPVSMRLMGLSWTMSPYGAGRLLELGGLVLAGIAWGLWAWDHRRALEAAFLAESKGGQPPSVPPAAPTT
ncbi:MAG: hypothetical protein WC718_03840 [Phycisphaerales bacterium]|jgi:hypothetical protein